MGIFTKRRQDTGMRKRRAEYMLLAGFAVVMVVGLMLDDPAARQANMLQIETALQAQRDLILYPEVLDPARVTGIDVLDVTTGTGRLVMRDEQGLWYAPSISGIQAPIPAEHINQTLVNGAASSLVTLTAEQWFEATADNLVLFGLRPEPSYRCRFRAEDAAGNQFESLIELGNVNPDNVAYYVYVDSSTNQRVYLVRKSHVDLLLTILSASIQLVPTPDVMPNASTATFAGP